MTTKRQAVSATERTADPWRNRIVGQGDEAPDQLLANPSNWRVHPMAQREALAAVLDQVGWVQRVIVNKTTQHVVDGHLRVALALSRDEPTIPVNYVELDVREEALVLAALDPIAAMATTDKDKLRELLEEAQVNDADLRDHLDAMAGAKSDGRSGNGLLAERFGVPPFTVLDARQGYWQDRKQAWLALGIKSELGREGTHGTVTTLPSAKLNKDGRAQRGDGRARPSK
jgi:hypothetical protein